MAVSKAQIDAILDDAKAKIGALFAPAPATTVTANLQTALNAASSGAILSLAPGFTTAEPITITQPVTILGSNAVLRGGLDIQGSGVSLINLTAYKDQARNDVVTITGDDVLLDTVGVYGHQTLGQKRGIATNGRRITLRNVTVDDIWLPVNTQDSQAVCGWDNCIDLLIEDSYLSAAGETLLIGGGDPKSIDRRPRNVRVVGTKPDACVLTKKLEWRVPTVGVKTTLELKNVVGFSAENVRIERSWKQSESDGQDGYLVTLTPRNQDGSAPYSSVEDVTIRHCTGGHAAGFLNVLGTDDEKPSGLLQKVMIANNQMADFDRRVWQASGAWGTNKLMQIVRGSVDMSIVNNVLQGNLGAESSVLYFDELPKSQRLSVVGNLWPKSEWGVFGGNSAPNQAWAQYVDPAGSALANNTEQ